MGCGQNGGDAKGSINQFVFHDDEKDQYYLKLDGKLRPVSASVYKQYLNEDPSKEKATCFAKTEDNKEPIGEEITDTMADAVNTRTFREEKEGKVYLLDKESQLRHIPDADTFKIMFGCDIKAVVTFSEGCGLKIGEPIPVKCGKIEQKRLWRDKESGACYMECGGVIRYIPSPEIFASVAPGCELAEDKMNSLQGPVFPKGPDVVDGECLGTAEEKPAEEKPADVEVQKAPEDNKKALPPPTTEKGKVDWVSLKEKLPTLKNKEHKRMRKKMFRQFDPNGNGYCSLAELEKGCRDVLKLDEVFDAKPVIMRAYQAAKSCSTKKGKSRQSDDYVEKREFRMFLVYLSDYFDIWRIFEEVDSGDDRRINLDEFKKVVPTLEEWGVEIADPEATFNSIDENGGGQILFDEFAEWALEKGLDANNASDSEGDSNDDE